MTIKRKNRETGEEEERQVSVKDILLGTPSFRTIIIILLLSQHPLGRQILGTFGFEYPDQRKLTVAAEQASESKNELTQLTEAVKELKADVSAIKANNSIINSKVDGLEQTFRGFQIDFSKWKPQTKPEP